MCQHQSLVDKMHATERDKIILDLLDKNGFISFHELSQRLSTSPATLRRDMRRLQSVGKLVRVRGGAQSIQPTPHVHDFHLSGVPFHENIHLNSAAKQAIGKAAARLCHPGEAVIIDGGSTTLQMCPDLELLNLQVLTNSLHIISVLLQQPGTKISIPGGTVFREQNIVLNPFDDPPSGFHAARMFCGCSAISRFGLMQNDIILIQAERKLLRQADELVVLVDSSKFLSTAPHSLCELSRVSTLITDSGAPDDKVKILRDQGIEVIIVDVPED